MSTPEQHHPDGALSDPLHDWWEKNGRGLIIGALILVIGTGVVFGFRAYRNSQEQTIQVEFNDAVVADELAAYAQENSGYPLEGSQRFKPPTKPSPKKTGTAPSNSIRLPLAR